jgi:hypothetical protein
MTTEFFFAVVHGIWTDVNFRDIISENKACNTGKERNQEHGQQLPISRSFREEQ